LLSLLDISSKAFFQVFALFIGAGLAAAVCLLYLLYLPVQIYYLRTKRITKERARRISMYFLATLILLPLTGILFFAIWSDYI